MVGFVSMGCDWWLPKLLRDRRVSLALLRHGNAGSDGQLTEVGKEQARRAGARFGERMGPVQVALSSPAARCVDTTQLFLEASKSWRVVTTTETLSKRRTFNPKLGYASLDAYLEDMTQTPALGDYAESAVQMLADPIKMCSTGTLLMCGHGIYISAVAQYIVYLLNSTPYAPPPSDEEYRAALRTVSATSVDHAAGFLIPPDGKPERI